MKRIYQIYFLFILLNPSHILPQDVYVKMARPIHKASLYKLEGEKINQIDTILNQDGQIRFSLSEKSTGFYRLQFDTRHWLNFINDGEDIEIKTNYESIQDSIRIIKSKSNQLYFQFLKLNREYKIKTDLLNLILARFPQEDDYYTQTQTRLSEVQNEYLKFVDETSLVDPKSFVARYIKTSQLPIIPDSIGFENHLEYLKSYALDIVDFNDADLIYSDAFTNKTIEYLTYYRNPQLPKELLEKEFMKAVDTLLNKAKVNQLVYQHITEYLIDGFKKFGFDKIIDYIVENYVIADDLCLEEELENSIQKRIDQSKLFAIGTKVPNIIMPDINDEIIDLSEIKSDKTLLVFYSSQCPHCQILLPQLNEFQKHSDLKIVAISLDNKQDDWIRFVEDNKLDLINLNDPNGWDGHLALKFYIYATPTMFLLDHEKKIAGKPITFKELEVMF